MNSYFMKMEHLVPKFWDFLMDLPVNDLKGASGN